MGLLQVPSEITRLIVQGLGPDDLLRLALCSRYLQYILWDQYICRTALQNYKFSPEYEEACSTGDYARALRRLAKRRDAVQTARPFQVVQIANATHFIYSHGAICYCPDRDHLRVLRLHDASPVSRELVIDVRQLLSATVMPVARPRHDQSYSLRPLHYASNMLSCLFSLKETRGWKSFLIVCDLRRRRVVTHRHVHDPRGLFVRNNEHHLYYGTRSENGPDRLKRWALYGLDLERGEWLSTRLILRDFAGTEIGSDICFEILEGYFYCLSNQEMVEPGETVQNSFYYALRFRLDDFTASSAHPSSQKIVMWRRQPKEGPVDDRWNTLELSVDEQSGKPFIVETRKELLSAVSQSLRTCYKMELVFPPAAAPAPPLVPPPTSSSGSSSQYQYADSDDSEYDEDWEEETHETYAPHILHHGDEESSPITLTFHQTFVRSYNASCEAFVDLVNDPATEFTTDKRLRLRSRPQMEGPQRRRGATYMQDLLSRDRDAEVKFWPDPSHPRADTLYSIINPQDQFDGVDSAIDARALVYAPKSFDSTLCEQARPLVLVSFDPALHLLGLSNFYENTCCGAEHLDQQPANAAGKVGHEDVEPCWIAEKLANYLAPGRDGSVRGFDMSREPCPSRMANES